MCWAHSGPSGKLLGIHWESQESTRSPRSPLGVHWEPWLSGNYWIPMAMLKASKGTGAKFAGQHMCNNRCLKLLPLNLKGR